MMNSQPERITLSNDQNDNASFVTGLALAVASSLFIGSSFIIKKVALKRINVRASAGGFGYLKQWLWWLGLLSMGVGEASNLLAYAFAPAALVTPLGALSVLVAAVLASRFLREKLNFIGKLGCLLCIIGSVMLVIHSPKSEEIETFSELSQKLSDWLFVTYVATICVLSFMVRAVFVPRFGNSHICVYLMLCSAVGSLTVVLCKAVALGVKESLTGGVNNLANYLFWVLATVSVLCIMVQMNYLNKSLDIFNTSIVTPVYYVMFTVLVIVASGILFREWRSMQFQDILGCLCGFSVVIIAIFMLNAFKDVNINMKDLNVNGRRNRRVVHSPEHEAEGGATF